MSRKQILETDETEKQICIRMVGRVSHGGDEQLMIQSIQQTWWRIIDNRIPSHTADG